MFYSIVMTRDKSVRYVMRTVLFMILCSIVFVMTRDKSVRYVMRTVLFMILCSIVFVMTRDKSVRYVMRTVLFMILCSIVFVMITLFSLVITNTIEHRIMNNTVLITYLTLLSHCHNKYHRT